MRTDGVSSKRKADGIRKVIVEPLEVSNEYPENAFYSSLLYVIRNKIFFCFEKGYNYVVQNSLLLLSRRINLIRMELKILTVVGKVLGILVLKSYGVIGGADDLAGKLFTLNVLLKTAYLKRVNRN